MSYPCKVLLITSNLGSVFEEPSIEGKWLQELKQMVTQSDPDIIALHCQEIGGKDFSVTMPMVWQFVKRIKELSCLINFDKMRMFVDTDFSNIEQFTALGNFYFIHSRISSSVKIWNYHSQTFEDIGGEEVSSFEELCQQLKQDQFHMRERFPNEFFPGVRWTRKGYLATKWLVKNYYFNLSNIHLFHNEDNLVALEQSPSCYSQYRSRALQYTLERLSSKMSASELFFLFGDFNFRLDLPALVKFITTPHHQPQFVRGENGGLEKVIYRNPLTSESDNLCIERRKFFLNSHSILFKEKYSKILQYDKELSHFKQLHEFPITFQPSYPFSEDSTAHNEYMEKRCPGWCDRIILNEYTKKMIEMIPFTPVYGLMGREVCTGDHKPVYLTFTLPLAVDIPNPLSLQKPLHEITPGQQTHDQ